MNVTQEVRRLILKNVSSGEIREAARRAGMRMLAEDGWRVVREGLTTPEEVLRVTKDQAMSEEVVANRDAKPSATSTVAA